MLEKRESGAVFIKDFAYSVIHLADDSFLDAFTHSFLIRDPEKVITSMHSRWNDIALSEIGFEDLHTLFRRVSDRVGSPPPVIDSDELLERPEAGMRAYCKAVGIAFIEGSTDWQSKQDANRERNPTWNTDEHGFHDSLKASSGLAKQKRDYPALDTSADMLRIYNASIGHYEAMYENRLRF